MFSFLKRRADRSLVPENIGDYLHFYEEQLRFNRAWANCHAWAYWATAWLVVLVGVFIAVAMLVKLDTFWAMLASLVLNGLMVIVTLVGSRKKYARYRMAELRLTLALQKLRIDLADSLQKTPGANEKAELVKLLVAFHAEVEKAVIGDAESFFAEMVDLQEIKKGMEALSKQMSAVAPQPGQPEPGTKGAQGTTTPSTPPAGVGG